MNVQDSIKTLERGLGIKLSKEQLNIVKYNIKTPVLVNACAGSGKTMLFLFTSMNLILSGQVKPSEILGVTFSKRAQVDMGKRYKADLAKLRANHISFNTKEKPYFTTFHALFYRVLRDITKHKGLRVMPSYQMIQFKLCNEIPYPSKVETKSEMLRKIFQNRDKMINNGLTYDGLHELSHPRKMPTEREQILLNTFQPQGKREEHWCDNYQKVVSIYNQYKHHKGFIDFTDMMVQLLIAITKDSHKLALARRIMQQFKVAFIDEFQDINDIQWILMRKLLSKTALRHLVVIGDDDQSIYSFRGSNPNIILEYHHDYPNSKTFNLSTNYRTGGNILQVVKPLITQNNYRLPKKLLTNQAKQGKFTEYFSNNKRLSANEMLMQKLLRQIKSKKINNNDIAILVHYNNSRMFVIDWLATHHCYTKISNRNYVLQNNYIYHIYMSIAKSLFFNRFHDINKYATRIGFQQFSAHIYHILNYFKKSNDHISLTDYCKLAKTYDIRNFDKIDEGNFAKDDDLIHYLTKLRCPQRANQHKIGRLLWSGVNDLTKTYFSFMIKKKYMNKTMVISIHDYLAQEFENLQTAMDVTSFFLNEQSKLDNLTTHKSKKHQSHVHIMSLHQSKGLQFKYVYLFDLNSRQDSVQDIKLNQLFMPNLKINDFVKFLLTASDYKLEQISKEIHQEDDTYSLLQVSQMLHKYLENNFTQTDDAIHDISNHRFNKTLSDKKVQQRVWRKYREIIKISKFIEEQRRLIYVGITRAQKKLYLAYNQNADPLLKELDVPKKDKYILEDNGQIMSTIQDHYYQRKLLKMHNKIK